jgi:outer membrane biogenesis lipoprotein LolB
MRFFTIFFIVLTLISCSKGMELPSQKKTSEEQGMEAQYQKELDEIKKSLKGDVKIKLKKDGKGGYSWEITGKDAQEVLKTNEALRKKLSD